MFKDCKSLKYLDVSSFNTNNAIEMASMFYNNYNLISLDLSSFNTDKVTTMAGMFYNCSKLMSLDLSNFNATNANINNMFEDCNDYMTIIS